MQPLIQTPYSSLTSTLNADPLLYAVNLIKPSHNYPNLISNQYPAHQYLSEPPLVAICKNYTIIGLRTKRRAF